MEDEVKLAEPYDWKIGARKAAFTAGKLLLGVAYTAVLQHLTQQANVVALVRDYPFLVSIAGLIAGGATFLLNRQKQLAK